MNEQLKTIDAYVSNHATTCNDIKDFLKKKAELDSEYSKKLEKLTDQHISKLNQQLSAGDCKKSSKEPGTKGFNGFQQCFAALLNISKQASVDVGNESYLTGNYFTEHVVAAATNLKQIHEQNRTVLIKAQEDFQINVTQLLGKMKTYQQSHAAHRNECVKFEAASAEFDKAKLAGESKGKTSTAKVKSAEKKRVKYQATRDETFGNLNQRRNEYLMEIEAVNNFVDNMYSKIAPQTVQASFLGHYEWFHSLFHTLNGIKEENIKRKLEKIEEFRTVLTDLSDSKDFSRFMENHIKVFLPKDNFKYIFVPHAVKSARDAISNLSLDLDLKQTFDDLKTSIASADGKMIESESDLRIENEEILEIAHKFYLESATSQIIYSLYPSRDKALEFLSQNFNENMKLFREHQNSYLQKNMAKMPLENELTILQGRKHAIEDNFGADIKVNVGSYKSVARACSRPAYRARPVIRPKSRIIAPLFGGQIDNFCIAAQVDVPTIVTGCIHKIVSTPGGLTHPGLFRLSGSQGEVNNLKTCFNQSENPFEEDEGKEWGWNNIAAVLKLYFRELEEPLFPKNGFLELIKIFESRPLSESQFLSKLTGFVTSLNANVMITMRYLFDFLNYLAKFSDENKMNEHNLAIVWAPTLLPIPDEQNQVMYQNITTELIEVFIKQTQQIFPRNYGTLFKFGEGRQLEESGKMEVSEEYDDVASGNDDDSLYGVSNSNMSLASPSSQDLSERNQTTESSESGEFLDLHRRISVPASPVIKDPSRAAYTRSLSMSVVVPPGSSRALMNPSPLLETGKNPQFKSVDIPMEEPAIDPVQTSTNEEAPVSMGKDDAEPNKAPTPAVRRKSKPTLLDVTEEPIIVVPEREQSMLYKDKF